MSVESASPTFDHKRGHNSINKKIAVLLAILRLNLKTILSSFFKPPIIFIMFLHVFLVIVF
ncbi:hypothetical protein MADA3029_740085 [Vibrio nigripulchritudo MADA3029]|nr:hypothetical protein VIBNIMADA3021_510088 [Vibrio nigripulchritudo MADA3021]CCN61234.1 hypothetical protein MADA3029_740085 [Vibrio nigripulchritudo MADA3029]